MTTKPISPAAGAATQTNHHCGKVPCTSGGARSHARQAAPSARERAALEAARRNGTRKRDGSPRRIIIALEPAGRLAMREEGRRTWYRAELSAVFRLLARWTADAAIREKAERQKAEGKKMKKAQSPYWLSAIGYRLFSPSGSIRP